MCHSGTFCSTPLCPLTTQVRARRGDQAAVAMATRAPRDGGRRRKPGGDCAASVCACVRVCCCVEQQCGVDPTEGGRQRVSESCHSRHFVTGVAHRSTQNVNFARRGSVPSAPVGNISTFRLSLRAGWQHLTRYQRCVSSSHSPLEAPCSSHRPTRAGNGLGKGGL